MRKWERIPRQILYRYLEEDVRFMRQIEIARECGIALGSVNRLLKKLERLGGIEIKPQGFRVTDITRILLFWANRRDLHSDIQLVWPTSTPVKAIERTRDGHIFTCFSAFKFRIGKSLREYTQVYLYGDPKRIQRLFHRSQEKINEIFVLEPEPHLASLSHHGVVPLGQLFVDLWQVGEAGKPWVDYLRKRIEHAEIGAIRGIIRRMKERSPKVPAAPNRTARV